MRERKVVVRFEGEDMRGAGFVFERTVDATASGGNPLFYGEQVAVAIAEAADDIRAAVEANYGRPGGAS
jgi:hypothetical protein